MQVAANINGNLLPGCLREIADLIGIPATMAIVHHYGGVRLYVPKEIPADHPLAQMIGMGNAMTLSDAYGGETLEIARAEAAIREIRDNEIREQWPALSQRQLALKYNTTERNIRRILTGCDHNEDQMQLFE